MPPVLLRNCSPLLDFTTWTPVQSEFGHTMKPPFIKEKEKVKYVDMCIDMYIGKTKLPLSTVTASLPTKRV